MVKHNILYDYISHLRLERDNIIHNNKNRAGRCSHYPCSVFRDFNNAYNNKSVTILNICTIYLIGTYV